MKKIAIKFIVVIMLFFSYANAQQCSDMPSKEKLKNAAKFDEYLDTQLHFTQEQKNFIKQNRQKYKKDLSKILNQMQKLHDEIRDVYILGIPKYQADIRTASKKAITFLIGFSFHPAYNLGELYVLTFTMIILPRRVKLFLICLTHF